MKQEAKKIQQAFHKEQKAERKDEKREAKDVRKAGLFASIFCLQVRPGQTVPPGFSVNAWFARLLCSSTSTTPMPTSTDTMAPVIAGLGVSAVTSSSATISWTTNEAATGNVYFGTSTPVGTSTSIGTTTLSTAHSITLNGLSSATTYRFFVESKDASGNRTTTAETSFTTSVLDSAAPVISIVSLTKVDATTARIDWTTNEVATGKVYFAPTSSVDLLTAGSVSTSTLSTSHSLSVSGIATGTTQFFVIESLDAFGNKATTTAGSIAF